MIKVVVKLTLVFSPAAASTKAGATKSGVHERFLHPARPRGVMTTPTTGPSPGRTSL